MAAVLNAAPSGMKDIKYGAGQPRRFLLACFKEPIL
jgi:hypothetical protein